MGLTSEYQCAKDEATKRIVGRATMTMDQLKALSLRADRAMARLRTAFRVKTKD